MSVDFAKLFQDVLPPDPNQPNVNVTQTAPTPDSGLLQKIGLDNINPFFTRRDPFMTAIIGKEGADRVLDQGTGTGVVTAGLTYGLTGDPFKAYLSGMEGSQKSVDKRKQSIFDMIKYSKDMKEYELMDYNALPDTYKVFGMMTQNPSFAKYQYMKDMYTQDMKEFEYAKENKDFIDFLLKMNKSKQAFSQVNIGNKNASDNFYKAYAELSDASNKAYKGLQMTDRMIDMYDAGFTGGMGKELAFQFSPFLQVFNKNFNAEELAQLQDFKAVSNQVVLPQVKQLGFNPTNVDLAFIVNSSPQLKNTDAGNMLMLNYLKEVYTRQRMVHDHMNNWTTQNSDIVENNPSKAYFLYDQELKKYQNQVLEIRKSYTQGLKEVYDSLDLAKQKSSGSTTNVNPNFKKRED